MVNNRYLKIGGTYDLVYNMSVNMGESKGMKVLIGKGNISHKQAIEKAEKEFEIYRKREMDMLESDFDKEIKRLKDKNGNNSK